MRFQLGTVVLLAAMGAAVMSAAEKTEKKVVDVYVDGRDGSSILLGPGTAMASAIFDKIGVRIHWRTGAVPEGANAIGIRTAEHAAESATSEALASTHLVGALATEITVYKDRLQRFLDNHRSLKEVAAAYVLAHELAHAMQGVGRHSETGIMRAHWSNEDYQEMVFHKLAFASVDVDLIHRGLTPQVASSNVAER